MAEVGNKFGLGAGGGQFGGYQSYKKASGRYYMPPHMFIETSGTTMNSTAARYYIVPFIVEAPTTFAGAWTYNGGAADNGDKVKIAAYSEATSGNPGALAKNFGEVTLTGASAVRTFASSWTANPGRYFLEMVTDNAVNFFCMSPYMYSTAVGMTNVNMAMQTMGTVGAPTVGAAFISNMAAADYVAGTYANFPESTSLAPTNTIYSIGSVPLFGLYA